MCIYSLFILFCRSLRSVAPHNTVVVGVGDPYIGFHHALEGGTAQPLLTEVARAAANKIMYVHTIFLKIRQTLLVTTNRSKFEFLVFPSL